MYVQVEAQPSYARVSELRLHPARASELGLRPVIGRIGQSIQRGELLRVFIEGVLSAEFERRRECVLVDREGVHAEMNAFRDLEAISKIEGTSKQTENIRRDTEA